jgi:hypothetical protein
MFSYLYNNFIPSLFFSNRYDFFIPLSSDFTTSSSAFRSSLTFLYAVHGVQQVLFQDADLLQVIVTDSPSAHTHQLDEASKLVAPQSGQCCTN